MKSKGSRHGVKGPGCDGWGMSVDKLGAGVAVDRAEVNLSSANFETNGLEEGIHHILQDRS
jgi:hypothetical protein